jgi:ketosteroid isomerase-like protein
MPRTLPAPDPTTLQAALFDCSQSRSDHDGRVSLAQYEVGDEADEIGPIVAVLAAKPASQPAVEIAALQRPAMTATTTVEKPAELTVSACVGAFNAHDLDGILAHLRHDVEFRPLRLSGIAGAYHGHHGIRQWLEDLDRGGYAHRIEISAVQVAADGRVLAVGTLFLADDTSAPFTTVHRLENGLIVEAHQYFSDQALLQRLGLFP